MPMISVAEALERVLAPLRPTGAETVPLAAGWGRTLAAPVVARLRQPPADMSAMDGYAVRAADATAGARLRVAGAAPAGHPFAGVLGPGEAVRLFTGSVVPPGADAVVIQEDTRPEGGSVVVTEAAVSGRHIRPAGQDFAEGDELVAAGTRLGARDIGLAAAGNTPWLSVRRRPRVAILATGDEIALPGEPIAPGGIVSSNAHALAALVLAAGCEPTVLPIAGDRREAIAEAADAAKGADLLVTTGGASVGEHDLVQAGLGERGFQLDFWTVAIRPGKPLISGSVGGVPVMGLPGNPVSALVCGLVFLYPALARLLGRTDAAPRATALLGAALPANDRREDYMRATLHVQGDGTLVATPFPRQDSGMLRTLARAQALIVRPPFAAPAAEGEPMPIIRLDTLLA